MDATAETPVVLLLDRDVDVIAVAQQALRREVDLHIASSLDLALRIAERRPVAVAVLDAKMAGDKPAETAAKLRALRHGLRIIFLAAPELAVDRRYGQIGPVLRKPITGERLEEAIRYALRLSGMSTGIKRMRESSGEFCAVRPLASAPAETTELERDSGEVRRESGEVGRDSGEVRRDADDRGSGPPAEAREPRRGTSRSG